MADPNIAHWCKNSSNGILGILRNVAIGVLVSKLHWKVFFADFYLRRCTQQSTRVTSTQFRSFPPLSKADLTLGVIIFHREIEALHHGKNCRHGQGA